MQPYPKVKTVWERDPETDYSTLIEGAWARPEFDLLKDLMWRWEEKVDGTNIRVIWDGENVTYKGKKERSEVPPHLHDALAGLLPTDLFRSEYPDTPMTLYGEGYGDKIQKRGHRYLPETQSFRLFDVRINDLWLRANDVVDIAVHLDICVAPVIRYGPLEEAIAKVREGFPSRVATTSLPAEGLVLKPPRILFDRRGRRIITKVKTEDFPCHD